MGLLGGSEGLTHGKPSEYASGDEPLRGSGEEGGKRKCLLTYLGAIAIPSLLLPSASPTNQTATGSLCREAAAGAPLWKSA